MYSKLIYLDDLSDEAIEVIAQRLPAKASPMSLLPIFPLGGEPRTVADFGRDFADAFRSSMSPPVTP